MPVLGGSKGYLKWLQDSANAPLDVDELDSEALADRVSVLLDDAGQAEESGVTGEFA